MIALHYSFEGEQAEIPKDRFGDKSNGDGYRLWTSPVCQLRYDFIRMANIMRAAGNMTVQQVNDPSTRKGDPIFMHNFNTAWEAALGPTNQSLYPSVQLGGNGNIIRIAAKKEGPQLETYIESFVEG